MKSNGIGRKIIVGILVVVLILGGIAAINMVRHPIKPPADGEVVVYSNLKNITKYGNTDLRNGSWFLKQTLKKAGIESGDTVRVRFLDQELILPVVRNYSEVNAEESLMRIHLNWVELSTNLGDFASTYFADKITQDNGKYTWVYKEGIEGPIAFHISLYEKGGAKTLSSLTYTDERSDYPNLTDEQFANFRMIKTTGIPEGTLYRTCSPVDPAHNRNAFADAAIRRAGVRTIMNLSDTKEEIEAFDGYADSYYSTTDYIGLKMGMSPKSEDFKAKLAQGLRFFATHEGPYAFHCLEGKDRTGIVAELLECFMGASIEEVKSDYMVTFYNYYGVEPGTETYDRLVSNNVMRILGDVLGTQDLENADLSRLAEDYFRSIGLTDSEIAALRQNLGSVWEVPAALPTAA